MWRLGWILAGQIAAAAVGCTHVDGDRIMGSDVARADASYSALPADFIVGFSPLPGTRRIVDAAYLARAARTHGFVVESPDPLCFERVTVALSEQEIRSVLQRVLGGATRVEVIDFSRYPVPKGDVIFAASELPRPLPTANDPSVIWRGRVRYGGRSTVAIWAKVRISKLERWVETKSAISAHSKISPDQVTLRTEWRFPFATEPVRELEQAVGQVATRSMRAGELVVPALLAAPNAVDAGDTVDAEVVSGAVRVRFSARAETAGHANEVVLVTAIDSGKRFRAYVQEKGKVSIYADTQKNPNRAGRSNDAGSNPRGRGHSEKVGTEGTGVSSGQVSSEHREPVAAR